MSCQGSLAGQFVEPRLKRCDAGVLRGHVGALGRDPFVRRHQPLGQRRDQRVLLGMAQLRRSRKQKHPRCRRGTGLSVKRFLTSTA